MVGAGVDKVNQEERTRIGGARAFIPASEKSDQNSGLTPQLSHLCLPLCAVLMFHRLPTSVGSFPLQAVPVSSRRTVAYSWSPGSSRPSLRPSAVAFCPSNR